jgi:hypothetical protein
MSWGAIILAILKIAGALADYATRRQLLDAGQAETIAAQLGQNLDTINLARGAADAVSHPASSADDDYARRVRDKYTRPGG